MAPPTGDSSGPAHDNSHGWVLGKTFCIVGIIVAGQADVAAGTAFLEIVGGYGGKVQGVIQFSECQQSGVGGDGGTMTVPRMMP